jgi:hypothetical protein
VVYDIVRGQARVTIDFKKLTKSDRVWLQWMNQSKVAIVSTSGQVWHWDVSRNQTKEIQPGILLAVDHQSPLR